MDLFPSRLSTQLPRFYSWRPDPQAEVVDAFSQDWSSVKGYAFPPFASIGRCLKQILDQQVSFLVLVAPVWQAQPWYPLLLEMCVAPPVLLPQYPGLVTRLVEVQPLSNLQLAGWLLSSNLTLRREFQKGLKTSWFQPGGRGPHPPIHWLGESGIAGRERKINSVHAPVEAILEFLTDEYNAGQAYRMLNVYRSAISRTHPSIDSVPVGEHPLGAFNPRPPLPRYSTTWDVDPVLSFIENLGPNQSLSLKELSLKLGFSISSHFCG